MINRVIVRLKAVKRLAVPKNLFTFAFANEKMKGMNEEIVLGREERYDTSVVKCWDFCKGTDVRDGVELKFGNMLTDFPFKYGGNKIKCSEMMYLCGQFSTGSEKHFDIQKMICKGKNGFDAKKTVRNHYIKYVRPDFNEFRLEWMKYVVWSKTTLNPDFQKLLLSVPEDAVIIENSSWQTGPTATVWGCKNMELRRLRLNMKREIENINGHLKKKDVQRLVSIETNKVSTGVFVGQNNLGKILMLCRQALIDGRQVDIDRDFLSKYDIHFLGARLF